MDTRIQEPGSWISLSRVLCGAFYLNCGCQSLHTAIYSQKHFEASCAYCLICFCTRRKGDNHLISSQSLNLGGRRGTTDDLATIPFHPSLSSAALRESPNPIPVQSLTLSSHLFFCLPLLLAPFTVPCRIVFTMPEDLEMWPYHLSFRFFTWLGDHHALQLHSGFCCEPPRSSHGLCRKCSEVSYSISSQGLGSLFLLSRSSPHMHKGR